ncbi:MAG: 50S ribosomal protein L17 [Polyangiaceae bacterium]
MRHKKAGRQFGRDTSSRRAMLRNLAANLITHERIETTDAKAKELRRVAERLISKAKRLGKIAYTPQAELSPGDKAKRLHAERLVSAYVPRFGVGASGDKIDIVEKVMVNLTKRFETRTGGYTRIIKLGPRRGDGAPLAMIELVDAPAVTDKVRVAAPVAAETEVAEAPAAEAAPATETKSEEKSE